MNDANSFGGYQEGPVLGGETPPQSAGPLNPGYRFSAEEMRVLGECNRESFFQRSLPLGTFLGLGAYAAVQAGHLRPNPRFGAFPKITLAVVVGYFLGKLSYQQACAEKLMNLPGSYIGQLLRDRRDGKIGGGRTGLSNKSPTMFGAGPGDIYSDAGPGSALDLDTERPLFSDDAYRPDQDSGGQAAPESPPRPALSYDELRRRNRGEYSEQKQDPYKMDPGFMPPPARRAPPPPTNKYGDSME
ncbi:OCIA domain-containing protein 1-like [Plodia interpunctella]|uniref:OCIA domain-containing protein 1-like n=1 Tax=Plodia interpunctella TaxID=58824 RepID=UPI002367FB9F|nr:OCIA domain-containing protein 1-like [Plodia interpunctella]